MDLPERQNTQITSVSNPYLLRLKCFLCQAPNPNINDENNNFKKDTNDKSFNPISKLPLYTCPDCEAKLRLEEKESNSGPADTSHLEEDSDQMIVVPDTSSDENHDECWCSSCTNHVDDLRSRQLWDDLSHVVKCVYRSLDKEFSANPFSEDIAKAKEYVKKLTEINPRSLFSRLESVVLEYVREIKTQVLERFQTCSKTSHDVQLFISFLLDEYNMFVQAATNVSTIVSYLEENYMKSFNLTWLLYNKHLYEKLIYMDRKIQHSMSTMIDLLQPSNEDNADYSPAEYTQLLNRFLAFDEEMSEIACLYKDSQAKMMSSSDTCVHHAYQHENNAKAKKKKKCRKMKRAKNSQPPDPTNLMSSATTAVDIPPSNGATSANLTVEQGSNGSSVGSGIGADDSSSSSSTDDYLLDNDTSSSGYTIEDPEELTRLMLEEDLNEQLLASILDSVSPLARLQRELCQIKSNGKKSNMTSTVDNDKWIESIIQEIQSTNDKQQTSTANDMNTNIDAAAKDREELVMATATSESPSKKSSSAKSKSTKSSQRRKENSSASSSTTTTTATTTANQIPKKSIAADLLLPRSIADLSAKIQSVSFTAGTFGSITSTNTSEAHSTTSPAAPSLSSSSCSTTTLTAAKTTTSAGQTRLSINLTRKSGSKANEHGGQKIAEALFNEITSLGNGESLNNGRRKDGQQVKKGKQPRSAINETSLGSMNSSPSFLNASNKADLSSSSSAYNNLDHLLRHAASNTDVSEAALHSILSSFHSPTFLDSSSKHSVSSKTTEALQTLLAQQQLQHHHHHHHHHLHHAKKNPSTNNSKPCEFCCCESPEGRTCSPPTCLHLSSPSTSPNAPLNSCVTCMTLPGATTSVMGAAIASSFNQRDVEMKERLKLKLTKRTVQNSTDPQSSTKDQQKKRPTSNKKPAAHNNSKTKESLLNDQSDIDYLVRFIDGNETMSSNSNEHQSTVATTPATTNESASKRKKKKDKQAKSNNNNNHNEEVKPSSTQSKEQRTDQNKKNASKRAQQNPKNTSSQEPSRSTSASSSSAKPATASPSASLVQTNEPTLSKRKQKAKLKLEQQQKETTTSIDESSTTSNAAETTQNPVQTRTSSTVDSAPPVSAAPTVPLSQSISTSETNVDLGPGSPESPEEEVNWITISRKQSKHKPSTQSSVPSLLAVPIPPVVVPQMNAKQQKQQQTPAHNKKTPTTTNPSCVGQQRATSTTATPSNSTSDASPNANKQQLNASTAPVRVQNPSKAYATCQLQRVEQPVSTSSNAQPSINLWNNSNIHEHTAANQSMTTSLLPPPTVRPTTSSYVQNLTPSTSSPSSIITPIAASGNGLVSPSSSMLPDGLASSMYWDPNGFLLPPPTQSIVIPSNTPGPVQRPNSSFSPAPGAINNLTSRCIQRPSPEPRTCSTTSVPFPLYSPMNYAAANSASSWSEPSITNASESHWNYVHDQQQQPQSHLGPSATPPDFPLYDPFLSGARLTLPPTTDNTLMLNGLSEHFADLYINPQESDVNEMDALDKEIEDFKKFCFESMPLETRDKMQMNTDRCFVRQA